MRPSGEMENYGFLGRLRVVFKWLLLVRPALLRDICLQLPLLAVSLPRLSSDLEVAPGVCPLNLFLL